MTLSRLRHLIRQHRPGPDRAWILGGVILLHLAVLGLLLTYRIILPEAPDGPVLRLETAVFVPAPPTTQAVPRSMLIPVPLPDIAPDLPPAESQRRMDRPPVRRPVEAVIAEEVLTPSVTANTLGARGFDLMAPPTYDAPYLQNRMPDYPRASRSAREAGTVVLRVLVTPQGRGHSADIHQSSGHARLDEVARQAVLRWRYVPAERGRRPVLSWTLISIRFQADGTVRLEEGALFSRD